MNNRRNLSIKIGNH